MAKTKEKEQGVGRTEIIIAVVTAIVTLIVAYWQFVWKPSQPTPTPPPTSPPVSQQVEYTGRVLRGNTAAPVRWAKVTLDFQSTPLIVYTDSEGIFRFTFNAKGERLNGHVKVEDSSCEPYDRVITIFPNNPNIEDIRLTPLIPSPLPATSTPTATPIPASTPTPIHTPTPLPTATRRPVVLLMDSTLCAVVYEPETCQAGGTNADDITDILKDLPLDLRKETTSLMWHREEQVVQQDPDLIIIHGSAFYDATNLSDPDKKFESFLKYMQKTHTIFLIYSRGASFEDETRARQYFETSYPFLAGRVEVMFVPGGPGARWDNPVTQRNLKLKVKSILGLP